MTKDNKPTTPPRPEKILQREAALRDNLLKRKQQQRARQQSETTPQPVKET